MAITSNELAARIKKGAFKPHIYLTNVCLSYFQNLNGFVAKKVFPIVPVPTSSALYYEFDKGDLARDNVARKPEFGHVAPGIYSKRDKYYHCEVDQVITGVDKIASLDFQRTNAPAVIDPRRSKVRWVAEQMNIHLDRVWAGKYFNAASWTNVYSGTGSTPAANQFYYFDNENSDPVTFFNALRNRMLLAGLRKPNKMVLGVNAFVALTTNPSILERIKYQGSEANPANVTANVLAQLFGLDEIYVAESVYNAAPNGAADDMQFICNPSDVLLTYTTNAPSIEEPSAGYTFVWDMLGNGQYTAVQQYEGEAATHTEFIEGLLCTDPEITSTDLGVFLSGAVSPTFSA
ncbi:MAG: hypothetical protein LBT88_01215 [Oscillospiraceae bacterium]|jgi:hypothetical protein|nr:hypothetical protein [Oscillospiraceae bacterium]